MVMRNLFPITLVVGGDGRLLISVALAACGKGGLLLPVTLDIMRNERCLPVKLAGYVD